MYYLSCVYTVISDEKDEEEINRFTDYKRYYLLSTNEKEALLLLVAILNPLIFMEAHVFLCC